MPTLYDTLGVSKDATGSDIKKAYHQLALKCHPDKHDGDKKMEEMFAKINKAKDILGDDKKRHFYDKIHMSDKKAKYSEIHPKGWDAYNVCYAFVIDLGNNQRATLYDFFEAPYHIAIGDNYKLQFLAGPGTMKNGKPDSREPTEDDFGTYEAVKDCVATGGFDMVQCVIGTKKIKKKAGKGPEPMAVPGRCVIC